MDSDEAFTAPRRQVIELTRVQPIEAELIVSRLRAANIPAIVGADSIYPSLTIAYGVPVYVSAQDESRARAVLDVDDKPT